MTIMARPIIENRDIPRSFLTSSAWIVVLWIGAAAAVTMVLGRLHLPSFVAAMAVVGIILLAAWMYARFFSCSSSVEHGLAVGITWLVLAIVCELLMTVHSGRPWNDLLGSPEHPLLRNLYLFVWIFAPVLFMRR